MSIEFDEFRTFLELLILLEYQLQEVFICGCGVLIK